MTLTRRQNKSFTARLMHKLRKLRGGSPKRALPLALGDGANDIPMIEGAGLGVAYHAKPKAREAAAAEIVHRRKLWLDTGEAIAGEQLPTLTQRIDSVLKAFAQAEKALAQLDSDMRELGKGVQHGSESFASARFAPRNAAIQRARAELTELSRSQKELANDTGRIAEKARARLIQAAP